MFSLNQFGPVVGHYTEWRARLIADPLERLRYLRGTARGPMALHRLRRATSRVLPLLLVAACASLVLNRAAGRRLSPAPPPAPPQATAHAPVRPAQVWQVESTADCDVYSNGLRVENRFSVSTRPRSYVVWPIGRPQRGEAVRRDNPAGIVFHTTESAEAPFEPGQNRRLQLIGESLLAYVRAKRAYNFVIDRFGRVFRVVLEDHTANHAGRSVWADQRWLYIDLNDSFVGVSFEARSARGGDELSPAQLRAGAILTEMLRNRYAIPAANCVTHVQVSVNRSNMRVGYHTDWVGGFPFAAMGLPDNEALPLPAIWAFGFASDAGFLTSAGSQMRDAVALAEEQVGRAADQAGVSVPAYRKVLEKRYLQMAAASRGGSQGAN